MSKFYRQYFMRHELADNAIVKMEKCLELIRNSEFENILYSLYNIDAMKDEMITISGLNKVISSVIAKDIAFEKRDINVHISNISCIEKIDDNTIKLRISNVKEQLGSDFIDAKTVYSTKREYFEGFYKMEKFANFCMSEGHFELLRNNIEYLNEKYVNSDNYIKKFRLLIDKNNDFYVRAITSVHHYNDYNIRFSLFVTILSLQKVIKHKGFGFNVSYCEYSESAIKIYFEKSTHTDIPNVGKLNFILEMSNDEIKREAFKFSGVFALTTQKNENKATIYLKPKNIKTKLVSIKHNYKTETVVEYLKELSEFIEKAEDEMISDIKDLNSVKNADELRFVLLRQIEKSNTQGLTEFKKVIKETLDTKIQNMNELLILMEKVDTIVTDLDIKEYLRYIFYDLLRNKQKK